MLVPFWDLSIVLQVLKQRSFKSLKRAILKDLALKNVFLIAITLAQSVSELQAFSCQDPFLSFSAEGVMLRTVPFFLPNVMSNFHINQSISLPSFPEGKSTGSIDLCWLDLARSLRHYLNYY